jgi:PAS domain S-box-containing protein
MTQSRLADTLEERASKLVADVEEAMSRATAAVPLRRTMGRLPGLISDLIGRLRADRLDEPIAHAGLRVRYDVVPFVTALGVLKRSIYALIDEHPVPVTSREERSLGAWFAAVSESALLTENRRFAEMLDAIPDHLLLYEADGLLINYVNRSVGEGAKEVAGMSREEVLGRRIVDIVHDKSFGRYVEDCLERTIAGKTVREEFIYPLPNGGRWCEHEFCPVLNPDGEVDSIVISGRDIHDRKKAEARLQLLSKLGTLAGSMDHDKIIDAVAQLSIPELADWCLMVIAADEQFQRATIAHRDPAKAPLAEELVRLPSRLQELRVGAAALAGASTLIVEIDATTEHADLLQTEIVRRIDVRSAIVVPIVVMGKTVAIATFMMTSESGRRYSAEDLALAEEMARRAQQIIENAKLHQQLQQSEARFRVALEHANIAVVETDLERRIRWLYNTRLEVPDSALLGKTASEVLGPQMGASLDDLQRRVLETGEGASGTLSAVADGKTRHFLARYEPLRDASGIVGLTGATVDVTELKEAEEQVARELAFRERMMGILGHDLRNPVTAVLSITNLMLGGELTDRARKQLDFVEQTARRMNEMIGTLLDVTRLRFHGALPITLARIGLDELARDLVAELRAAHGGREIELSVDGSLRGEWDPGRMAQLFTNLVANALTHGDMDSPVSIRMTGGDESVLLSVSNRGPGIPPERIERLFEPFQQGNDASDGRRRGLGLGLFIVREIVRAHRGMLDVRSCSDLTTFVVTLPRAALPS